MKHKADVVAILMAVKIGVIILFLAFMCALSSCTPKSAMWTKAVVIDSKPRATDAQTSYKIHLFKYRVTDYFVTYQTYDIGDTILVHDRWRNYDIR